jgi:hypothetical protein
MTSARACGLWGLVAVAMLVSPAAAESGIIPYEGPDPGLNVPVTTNINSADTVNADRLWSGGGMGLNLSGAGLTVGVWDGGYPRTTHQEFGGRVIVMDSGGSTIDHATHVIGTLAAAGIDPNAHGMANQVTVWSYEWTNDTVEMAAAADSIVASNHSYAYVRGWTYTYTNGPRGKGYYGQWYGNRYSYTEDPYFGKYDSTAQALDQVLYDHPNLLSVWAAGNDRGETWASLKSYYLTMLVGGGYNGWYWVPVNDPNYPAPPADGSQAGGYDCLPQEQTAKNTLVVGAIHDITADPYGASDVVMTTFSAWGPTDDGRVKPDVVACGYQVHSTVAASDTAYDGDPAMGDSSDWSGTSMAAPNVTGTATLLIEHYRNVRGSMPRSATTKGIIIHTAFDAGNPGPDYVYGWGVLKADDAATFITNSAAPGSTDAIFEAGYTGAVWDRLVYVGGTGSVKTTLVWTDPPPTTLPGDGLDDPTSVLVHDLDLLLYGSTGGLYYPWTLNPADPSAPAVRTAANHRDNVEQVLVDTPAAGWYAVSVSGGAFSQDFSLLLSGGQDFGAGSMWLGNPAGPSDWPVAGNWAPLAPRPADIALIDNGGTAVISGGTVSVRMIAAGERYAGSVLQSGGTTTVQDGLHLGHAAAAAGTFTLNGGRMTVGGNVDLGGAAGARGLLNVAGGSLTAAGPIVLASGAGGTGRLDVSKTAYVKIGGLIANTGDGRNSQVSLELASDGHALIHTTAASMLGGTIDMQAVGAYRPREGDAFAVIASTDPSGVHFVGDFSTFTSNITLGLPLGSGPFGGQVSGSDYELVFLGFTDGDADGNHWVDAGDLSLMGAAWQLSGQSWATGDFSGDGAVDAGDLSLLGANWNWHLPSPAPGGASVPEPAILVLLGLTARDPPTILRRVWRLS